MSLLFSLALCLSFLSATASSKVDRFLSGYDFQQIILARIFFQTTDSSSIQSCGIGTFSDSSKDFVSKCSNCRALHPTVFFVVQGPITTQHCWVLGAMLLLRFRFSDVRFVEDPHSHPLLRTTSFLFGKILSRRHIDSLLRTVDCYFFFPPCFDRNDGGSRGQSASSDGSMESLCDSILFSSAHQ